MMPFIRVCDVDELWDGELAAFELGQLQILLVRLEGTYHAYQANCPHQSVPLEEGSLDGHTLTCRAHLWQFDLRTGRGINPASACLRRHPLKVEGNAVHVSAALEGMDDEWT
jgi:nitrite reductase/ring-hydroxylating ferredoxin subunit